ncbi:MAG TPA: peptidoglycan-binding domain-containing protein [Myxococcota bacterium]|nr:peptidoglycan-binding domain-containing protein [Myxococcota bacterium]
MSASGGTGGAPPAGGGSGNGGGGDGGGLIRSLKHDLPYLENLDDADPLNRLALGALDDKGASWLVEKQTVYDGYVRALQTDLWELNFRENFVRGAFDAAVQDAVVTFQRHAGSTQSRAKLDGPVTVTYSGGPTGVVDAATRREIKLWKDHGWYRYTLNIGEGTVESILSRTSKLETGMPLELTRRRYFDRALNMEIEEPAPRAWQFMEEDKREGLRVGILGYSQRSGWLGRLVKFVYECDNRVPPSFFGDDFRNIYNLTNQSTERGRMAASLSADDRWRRFLHHPLTERANVFLAWEDLLKPLYAAAERNKVRTIKGLAFFFDLAWCLGLSEAEIVMDACGPRDLSRPVRDHLATGLYTLGVMVPPGKRKLLPRFQQIADAGDLDETAEYFWDISVVMAKQADAPRRL